MKEELAKRLGISLEEFEAQVAKKAKEKQSSERLEAEEKAAGGHVSSAPLYPGAEVLSMARAREILSGIPPLPENPEVDGVFDPEVLTLPSVQLIRGPLELDSLHLPAEGSNLFIDGTLTVKGILKQDFRAGGLLVLGDMVASHIVTTGEIDCTGSLNVKGVLYGNCTNYGTNVWGPARLKTVMSAKEHYFCFWGGREIETLIDVYGDTPNLEGADYDGSCMEEFLHSDIGDGYNEEVVFELLKRYGTILAEEI